MAYRERTEEPSEYSWWRGLCEKHARLFLILFFSVLALGVVALSVQTLLMLHIADMRATLDREKFEAQHPPPCQDEIITLGVNDESCPVGSEYKGPLEYDHGRVLCKCKEKP